MALKKLINAFFIQSGFKQPQFRQRKLKYEQQTASALFMATAAGIQAHLLPPQYFLSDGFGIRETQGRVAGGDYGRCPRTDVVFPRNPSPRNLPDCLKQTVAV